MQRRSIFKLLGLALASESVIAQTAPRTIRLVVPLGTGSPSDAVARLLAPHLSTGLGTTMVVDNKVGGNGIIGVQDVIRSPTDGSTLLLGSVSPLAINMALVKNLPYDPRRDLTPITGAYTAIHVLIVKASHPARTFAEFIEYAKQRPGRVSVGHSATLVKAQILAINKRAGIELQEVPYKGMATTLTDVLGGTLDATFYDPATTLAQVKSGAIRALAVTSLKRSPLAPEWPAISETLPDFDFASWSALVGPPGMSRDVVNKINTTMGHILKQKEVLDRFAQAGIQAWHTTPDELKTFIEAQTARWIKLTAELGIQAE